MSIRLCDPWDGDALGYDAWKTRLPDSWSEQETEYLCCACEDHGWMDHPEEGVIPCTECSQPITLQDLEDFRL
jgi:hypothetical protein